MKNLLRVILMILVFSIALERARGQTKKTDEQKDEQKIVRLRANLITVTVTVADPYERLVTGLQKDHFEIYDEKIKQEIVFFAEEDAPISIGIVFDISGSMEGKIQRATVALRRFIEISHPDDNFFLIAFNHMTTLVQDFTTSVDEVVSQLTWVKSSGRTALYDATYLAVEKVRQGRHTRKAILIISDGLDNSSRYTYSQLRNILKEAGIQIYALGIFDLNSHSDEVVGRSILEEITSLTGGRAFFPDNPTELEEAIIRIALELRHQYSLGFYPSSLLRAGEWHKIRVRIKPPKGLPRLNVRSKEGYVGVVN